jgi:hypothetical protein
MKDKEPEIRRVDEAQVEERSLAQTLGAHALDGGATTIGVLAAKDLYAKAKDMLRPGDDEPKIILPPGTNDNE